MNVVELRNSLIDSYQKLLTGEISINKCKEASNTAGKIISTARNQLEYEKRHDNKRIDFFEV